MPPPATVPQGLWRDIQVARLGDLEPSARVTVLIDGPQAAAERTRAALEAQTYPAALVDVAAANGEDPEGEVIVCLGAGALPAPDFLAAHARWHHAVADAVSFGPTGASADDSALGIVRDLTRDLTDLGGGHHLVAAEGSVGVRRDLYLDAGGGGDAPAPLRRLDLAYRLHTRGAVFVAEPTAFAQAEPGSLAVAIAQACERGEQPEVADPVATAWLALPPFREPASPRRHRRAAAAVNVEVGPQTSADDAVATLVGVLASGFGDFELRAQVADSHPERARIAATLADDPRAELGPSSLARGTEAPLQITVPPVAALDPRTLGDLCELALFEDAGALHVTVPGVPPQDGMIEVVTTAARSRAQRLAAASGEPPEQTLARLYPERWVSGVEVSARGHGVEEPQVTEHGPLAAATDLDHERNAHLRFRDRAGDLAQTAETLASRTLAERIRARRERQAAERVEARLPERRDR